MTLPTRASILRLNQTVGGHPAILVKARGKQKINLNTVIGGQLFSPRGFNIDGNVNVNGTWKPFDKAFINVNGTWKDIEDLNNNISDTWKY